MLKDEVHNTVVVCPLSALGVWEDEFALDCPDEIMPNIITVVGDMKDRIKTLSNLPEGNKVVVLNYESLLNVEVMSLIKRLSPELLIVDEMHYCKNHTARRSKAVYEVRKVCKYFLGLTGTPLPKDPLDLFGQYKIINDEVFGADRGAYKRFRDKYAIMNYKFPTKVDSWKNLDELARVMYTNAYRAKDSECVGLPELVCKNIPVFLDKKTKKIYNQMATDMIAELDNEEVITAAMAASKVIKLQQITGGFIMRKDEYLEGDMIKTRTSTFPVGDEKLKVCKELVEKHITKDKIIIGCRFVWEINQIAEMLEKSKIGYKIIRGGVSGDKRAEIRREFQKGEDIKVIVFQVSAATAMTLTRGNVGILYSCTQKWDDYWQWLKRLHREGQNKPVVIYRLMAKGSIDEKIIQSINDKRNFTECMVDRKSIKGLLRTID